MEKMKFLVLKLKKKTSPKIELLAIGLFIGVYFQTSPSKSS